MSNPVATINNFIPQPGDPQVVRKTFTRIVYDSQQFFVYGENEFDPTYATFDPSEYGERFYMFVPLDNALGGGGSPPGVKPDFVSDEAWSAVKRSPSGFVQGAVNSIMPKIIVPSDILVDNGLLNTGGNDQFFAFYRDGAAKKDLFNWEIISVNGAATVATEFYKYAYTGAFPGSKYVTARAKDDLQPENEIVMELDNPAAPPLGSAHDWLLANSTNLVVGGAFALMLNVVPSRPASSKPGSVSQNPWSVKFEFGDIEMELASAGEMKARISGGSEDWVTVNMVEGKAKGGPPQQEEITDKNPFIIVVFPVWNGIVIGSGVQEARTNSFLVTPVLATSTYVPKLKEASIFNPPWSDGFDPTNPDEVKVGMGSGATDVSVDFGGTLTTTVKNCRCELAYLPCFFSKNCWFDEWFITSDDIPAEIDFEYDVYPIWTDNGTSADLTPAPDVTESSTVGPVADTHYSYVKWRLEEDHFNRISGQIFGSVFEVEETREFPVRNSNGNFDLIWTGGTPGDPAPSGWEDYIQSISVNIGIDGSSGSITVDKYGPAGQAAVATQDIGAITIDINGGFGTQGGNIFQGLAMGISEAKSSGGALWTIPMVGLEKKLDDIALINVPFFDGEFLGNALGFLTRYAGIISDTTNANVFTQLSVSEDINVARFDWKSGTTVRTALEDVMNDVLHNYVVQDGKIEFYQLDGNGLPIALGPDWAPQYPDTKTVSVDQTPDFEDLRNEVVVIGLEPVFAGQGTNLEDVPTVPRFERIQNVTVPNVPWSKAIVEGPPGLLPLAEIQQYAQRLADRADHYESIGHTTIPGNANIKVYDRWNGSVIASVTHNVDLQAKTWTTDLEFMEA